MTCSEGRAHKGPAVGELVVARGHGFCLDIGVRGFEFGKTFVKRTKADSQNAGCFAMRAGVLESETNILLFDRFQTLSGLHGNRIDRASRGRSSSGRRRG